MSAPVDVLAVCECGCAITDIDGQQYCSDTLAKFRLIHGYDYALRLKAGESLFGKAMDAPALTHSGERA